MYYYQCKSFKCFASIFYIKNHILLCSSTALCVSAVGGIELLAFTSLLLLRDQTKAGITPPRTMNSNSVMVGHVAWKHGFCKMDSWVLSWRMLTTEVIISFFPQILCVAFLYPGDLTPLPMHTFSVWNCCPVELMVLPEMWLYVNTFCPNTTSWYGVQKLIKLKRCV